MNTKSTKKQVIEIKKVWLTITLWQTDNEIDSFYQNEKHLEAMKQSRKFSSKIQIQRIIEVDLIRWAKEKNI